MTLLRRVLGEALRGQRLRQRRTLREVSGAARVSLGYLSEVERGQKEASSELLASICGALDVRMSDLLREVSDTMRRSERAGDLARVPARTLVPAGVGASRPVPPARRSAGEPVLPLDRGADRAEPAEVGAGSLEREPAAVSAAADPAVRGAVAAAGADLSALAELGGAVPVPPDLVPADLVPADLVPADRVPARFDRFVRDGATLDGLELAKLAELETADELDGVEVLLSLTNLLRRPEGGFGPHPMRGELAGAGVVV
jgi:transcriptional regulator with XRE-family HTH domain